MSAATLADATNCRATHLKQHVSKRMEKAADFSKEFDIDEHQRELAWAYPATPAHGGTCWRSYASLQDALK